ncbi:uncharacterized protein LOC133779491 [Humulus lupulus]|uniref:uncharacterized protein LOC133779491 n=1 Tax=Humulus lupulus TaxID=3486 RepID=UPI002B412098|nr:uncharacterized protein LOC133779491 [Humulus lupulus]
MSVTGSNSEQPQFIASAGNRSFSSNAPLIENSDAQIVVPDIKDKILAWVMAEVIDYGGKRFQVFTMSRTKVEVSGFFTMFIEDTISMVYIFSLLIKIVYRNGVTRKGIQPVKYVFICNFTNFARNIHCLKCKAEGPKKSGGSDIEMKKGDWNYPKWVNFSQNYREVQVDEQKVGGSLYQRRNLLKNQHLSIIVL